MDMKVLTVLGPMNAEYSNVPAPAPEGDMIKIKVMRTGICATDFAIFTGDCSFVRSGEIVYPVRFGHEFSGIVTEVGENVKNFKVGDRVYTDNGVSCGKCADCLDGRYGDCRNSRSVGTVNCWEGCYAEYMYMPERHVYPIPDSLSYEQAALIEPTSISLDAFTDVEVNPGDTAVIIGTGAIGMASAWLAKYFGFDKVVLVGRSPDKLDIALKIGADEVINSRETDPVKAVFDLTGGCGAQLVVETSGDRSALISGINFTAKKGRVSALSFYEHDLDGMPIDRIVLNRITLRGGAGCFGYPQKVAKIMTEHKIDLTPIITNRIKFDDTLDFFKNEEKYHSGKVKAMVVFDD
ncbi:MAG: alcohol dehydrogenase catalytic domain-containing protein [Clostridia bacterium]|nr:alcohol dehydrogenase catalytic domain-containing protein [Clostridia bacterium]